MCSKIIEWEKLNSFYREYKETYEASISGIKACVYFDTGEYPFVWRLDCRELDIIRHALVVSFEESKKEAVKVLRSKLAEKINSFKKILSQIE